MKSLANQQWIGLSGEPVTGRIPPRLLVMNGVEPTPGQMGLIAHHYKLLTYALHTAVVPYMVQERTLVDGTRIRMVSNYGTDTVMVWPAGGATKQIAYRGFIADPTALTLKDPVDWAAERYTATYTYKDFDPILMKLNKARDGWEVRTKKFMHGVATNYSVMNTPARVDLAGKKWGANDFFDVAYIKDDALTISWTDKKLGAVRTQVLKDLPATGAVPIVFPPSGIRPRPSVPGGDQLHLYLLSTTGAKHVGGRDNELAGEFDAQAAVDDFMPITSDRMGKPCFGYDGAADRASFFVTHAAFFGPNNEYEFLFYWYASTRLLRTPPYLQVQDAASRVPARPSRQYRKAYDAFTGASRPFLTLDVPEVYTVPTPGPLADIFLRTRFFVRDAEDGTGGWVWIRDTGSYGGQLAANRMHVYGTTYRTAFTNSFKPYDEAYTVGTQRGPATLTHKAEVSVDFQSTSCSATVSYSATGVDVGYLSVWWPGYLVQPPYGESPQLQFGSSSYARKTNTSTTKVRYSLEGVDLFSMDASISFVRQDQSSSQMSYTPRDLDARIAAHSITSEEYLVPPEPLELRSGVTVDYVNYSLPDIATGTTTTTDLSLPYSQTSVIDMTTRDYLFHDMVNRVAVYLKATGHCTTQVSGGSSMFDLDHTTGVSSWDIRVIVEASDEQVEVPIMSSTGGPSFSLIEPIDAIFNGGAGNPHIMYPKESPAIYAPVCEQGDFKYIAYTTRDEEARGVAPHFILSLPLGIARRTVGVQDDPVAPAHCYTFTAYNLTEASGVIPAATFGELIGRAFHINVTQGADRKWVVDLKVDDPNAAQPDTHFADCYRI